MGRCNVTGATDVQTYDFYINADFGYNAQYLNDKRFEFELCQDEHDKFMSQGKQKLSVDMSRDNYANLRGKWFTSEQVYDLISTFQHPPKGYFSEGWLQFKETEEQVLWDRMDRDIEDCFDMFGGERAEELRAIQRGF